MDGLLDQLGQGVGDFAGDPVIRVVVSVAFAYLVLLWLAAALWAFVDMRRRTTSAVTPYATAAVVIVASPVLFPLALLLHLIVRPRETVVDRQVERLRDTVLEAEADLPTCPSCSRPIEDEWLVCPACRVTLAHRCERCRRAVAADWDACPWCAASFEPPAEAIRTAR
jgi:predicted RNA-binding Zn-ribbon protein involved in translation (DUF1610 family)